MLKSATRHFLRGQGDELRLLELKALGMHFRLRSPWRAWNGLAVKETEPLRLPALLAALLLSACAASPPPWGSRPVVARPNAPNCDTRFLLENGHSANLTRFEWRRADSSDWTLATLPAGGISPGQRLSMQPATPGGYFFRASWEDGASRTTDTRPDPCDFSRLVMRDGATEIAWTGAVAEALRSRDQEQAQERERQREARAALTASERVLETYYTMPAQERWPGALSRPAHYSGRWYFDRYDTATGTWPETAYLWSFSIEENGRNPTLIHLQNYRTPKQINDLNHRSYISERTVNCKERSLIRSNVAFYSDSGATGQLMYHSVGEVTDRSVRPNSVLSTMINSICARVQAGVR